MSLYTIKALIILDDDGERIIVKYYVTDEFTSLKSQEDFESVILQKSVSNVNEDVFMIDRYIVVFKTVGDVTLFIVGGMNENEILLSNCLNTLYYSLQSLLPQIGKNELFEHYDMLILTVDELIDGGIYFECESENIVKRVNIKSRDTDSPITEQSFGQALLTAKEQITKKKIL